MKRRALENIGDVIDRPEMACTTFRFEGATKDQNGDWQPTFDMPQQSIEWKHTPCDDPSVKICSREMRGRLAPETHRPNPIGTKFRLK